jgi:hypothetical protein
MNTNDHPDLTAYALGELDAEHSEAMAQWVAENPAALAEADATAELGEHLRNKAPVPNLRLHPHQRAAILNGPQRVRQLVAAATHESKPRPSRIAPFFFSVTRIAAAAVVVIGAFVAGRSFAPHASETVVVALPSKSAAAEPKKAIPAPVTPPFRAKEVAPIVAANLTSAPAPVLDKPAPAPAVKPTTIVATVPVVPVAKQPAASVQPVTRVVSEAFVSTSKSTAAQVVITPNETRFVASGHEVVAASPATPGTKSIEPAARAKQSELRIHSWKAEIASCPWNEAHRLVRLTVQIPGEQEAAASKTSYPLQVSFDANYVRSFRQLSQRSIAASAPDAPAFHIVWYEFQPNGQAVDAAREGASKLIGSVTLPNAKFTTPATGPFDGSRLRLIDRGQSWTASQDDFLFESAITGFGLLMKGDTNLGGLNHALVLDLAQRSLANDRNGERAKFVKLVQDAQRMAGL